MKTTLLTMCCLSGLTAAAQSVQRTLPDQVGHWNDWAIRCKVVPKGIRTPWSQDRLLYKKQCIFAYPNRVNSQNQKEYSQNPNNHP